MNTPESPYIHAERTQLADGRYLIYFTFETEAEQASERVAVEEMPHFSEAASNV